jgi:hypothetical protein
MNSFSISFGNQEFEVKPKFHLRHYDANTMRPAIFACAPGNYDLAYRK